MDRYEIGAICLALGFVALLIYGLLDNRRRARRAAAQWKASEEARKLGQSWSKK